MKKLLIAIIIMLFGFGIAWGLDKSISKSEKLECEKWLGWEDEHNVQRWADWQVMQCKKFNIELRKSNEF